jgi:phenylalanyl-tRNA synthetase beta chain
MLVPLSWLKEFVDIEENAKELAEKLLFSGTKVEETLTKNEEEVFDLEITPNRGDCLGIIGVAREIAAIYRLDLKLPEPFSETMLPSRKRSIKMKVKDKNLCPYYTIGIIDNLKIQESPEWLKKRLDSVGIRPINNIVDITNYVMMETSQPMHAFDFDKVRGDMVLRAAKEGEKVTTLDGIERSLNKGAIIIEDSEKLIDLAGLMGGQNSEVDKNTQTIVLHVPIYNSVSIRRASQHTGLRTEASNRFEKQLDTNGHRYAFERALHLLKIESGGILSSDIRSINYPTRSESLPVSVTKINNILGVTVSEEKIVNILVSLGFEVLPSPSLDEKMLEVRPPTWRPDVKITEDVAEEVGRIWGYNQFPKTLPSGETPTHEDSFLPDLEKILKESLQGLGFFETYSHSMTSGVSITKFGGNLSDVLKVNNRMTIDYEYLRPSLLIGLLESVSLNLRNFDDVSLYELGRVFLKEINSKNRLPKQPRKTCAVQTSSDFSKLKGLVIKLLEQLNIEEYEFDRVEGTKVWSPNSAKLKIGKEEIGILGSINKALLANFSIEKDVFSFELDFDKLTNLAKDEIRYKPLPKYPVVKEDLSVAFTEKTTVHDVLNTVRSLKELRILNVNIAEIIPWQGKKSILLNLEYYDQKKTLTDKESGDIRKKIVEILKKKLKAEIRSK